MICINNKNTNPYFNLATEEYVLDNFTDDVFMIWRNEPSIIIGKFQNTIAEINLDYVKRKSIKVVRRLTGGGAVFHDLGNLNFTFIENNSKGDFRSFTEPILEVLQDMGINSAKFEGRNDLTIDGKKFSGNAQCVRNKRMLHHGTILFSSEMTDLSAALKANPLKFEDKAVKSVRKRVTNISEHLNSKMNVEEFGEKIMNHIMDTRKNCKRYSFNKTDIENIEKLQNEKYSTWEWNFGKSPQYSFSKAIRTNGGNVEIHLKIDNGKISDIKIFGDFFAKKDISELEKLLIGKFHKHEEIEKILQSVNIDEYISNATNNDILKIIF